MEDNTGLFSAHKGENIMQNNNLIPKTFNEIQNNLSMHVNNKYLFREDQVRIYNGVNFENSTDWSSKNMRRIYFSDCKFSDANLRSTGFTGSIFKSCDFVQETLEFTIFDEVLFIDCNFYNCTLKASSFCKSEFTNCKMVNLDLDACFFTDAIFDDFEFSDCKISDIIWENSKFKKCVFSNVVLRKLNLEFTYFEDVHFDNTAIPFASLPFVFGGIGYILNTNDNVYIKTVHPDYKNQILSKSEYLELLPDLLAFYKETSNYFPLANILLGTGRIEEGVHAIEKGLEFWFNLHNHKIMYYFCDLANSYNFSIDDRKKIFSIVQKCNTWILNNENWSKQTQWNVQQYRMRNCLLNSQSIPYVTLEFLTSIKFNNYSLLSEFMQTIDALLPTDSYYSLELRHNSPCDLLYTIFAGERTLFNFIVGIATIFSACDQFYSNHIKERIKKKKTHQAINNQTIISDKIKDNITNINYNFYNCNINNLDTDHFTRQSTGCVNPDSSGNNQ